jgi:polyribonucleotide nucleotidyltransferase
MLGAVSFAHEASRKVIDAIIRLAEQSAKEPWELEQQGDHAEVKQRLRDLIGEDLAAAYKLTDKQARQTAVNEARAKAREAFEATKDSDPSGYLASLKLVKKLEAEIVRGAILKEGRRIDGRDTKTVRPIEAMVGFLPRTHGSSLFTRGETQAICTTTLGTKDAEQMIDGLEGLSYQSFMLHYNFPPYSVGEVGRFGAPGRREVGHGKLAWRALHPVLPSAEDFPVHDPRHLRHHGEQWLFLDGQRVRRQPCADGCGRADHAARFRDCHGPDPGRLGLCRAVRHPG